jgi:ABC-type multidrug transport system fused ATPase/permease subunit
VIGNVTIGLVLLYGGSQVLHGHMTIGTFAAFLLYLRMFFEPMHEMAQFLNDLLDAQTALEKLAAALNRKPAIEDPQAPRTDVRARGSVACSIAFNSVHFGYVPGRPVLAGLSVAVPAGQTVALVGKTGAGKTTVAKLLARFYDPTRGSITLDGVDLRDLPRADLRRRVVMVTQENFLFSGTIADNIRIGRPEATEAEVKDAAAAIGADRFIDALPDGFDTEVDNCGVLLSGGQRQLIALARAFLADPAVLIVDEATSSLDVPSERMVQRALAKVLAHRTALIIAPRMDAVGGADRVLVLGERGQIVADAAPAEAAVTAGHR